MAKKIKDTDYLGLSARVRAMETNLLTRERMERLLEARSNEEAGKLLQECGYPELDPSRPEEMDAALFQVRRDTLEDLADSAPDRRFIDVFRLPYDYHNAKALLKAAAQGTDPASMLLDLGRVPVEELRAAVRDGDLDSLPGKLGRAWAEAKEVLETTRDPQLSDIILDNWSFKDLSALADETGSAFLKGYVRVRVDAANLRSLLRTLRMGKGSDFLKLALFQGGEVDPEDVLRVSAASGAGLDAVYGPTALREAAECGAEALKNGAPLTEFERLCDDAVSDYLSSAQFVPFGEAPLVGYLAARETEYTNLRIVLLGRGAGLSPEVIRSRLRTVYA